MAFHSRLSWVDFTKRYGNVWRHVLSWYFPTALNRRCRYKWIYNGIVAGTYSWGLLDAESFGWSSSMVTATNVPNGAASITNQPKSVVVHAHDIASFSVAASGTVPLSYQWSLNGTKIAGATSSSLTISNVVQTNLGTYAAVVTNAFGSATSSNAMLSMYPFIATAFTGAVTYWGKAATFSVQAWGTGPLDYQWYQDGVAIQNATNQTLTLCNYSGSLCCLR